MIKQNTKTIVKVKISENSFFYKLTTLLLQLQLIAHMLENPV